eukprot:tig00000411_g575.t1
MKTVSIAFRRTFARDAYRPRPALRLNAAIAGCAKTSLGPASLANLGGAGQGGRAWIAVYGGTALDGRALDDLWLFEVGTSAWRGIERPRGPGGAAPWPPPLRDASMVFAAGALWLWGGPPAEAAAGGGGGGEAGGSLWRLEVGTWRWSRVQADGPEPPARPGSLLLHDHTRGRLLVFGGAGSADLSFFSLEERSWRAAAVRGDWPEPTASAAGWVSQDGFAMAVFGGNREGGTAREPVPVGDTWLYLFEEVRWVRLPAPAMGGPGALDGAAAGTLAGVHVLFGGHGPNETYTPRCLAFDFGPALEYARSGAGGDEARWWQALQARGAPSRRSQAALVSLPGSNQHFVVGGRAYRQSQAISFIEEVYSVGLSGIPLAPASRASFSGSLAGAAGLLLPSALAPAPAPAPAPGPAPSTFSSSEPPEAPMSPLSRPAAPLRFHPRLPRGPLRARLRGGPGRGRAPGLLRLRTPRRAAGGARGPAPRSGASFSEQLASALEELASRPEGPAPLRGARAASPLEEAEQPQGRDREAAPVGPEAALAELERRGQECMQRGDLARAEALFRVSCACGLGEVYFHRGELAEAEALFRRALEVLDAGSAPEGPRLVSALAALGATLAEQGRAAEAAPLLRRALGMQESAAGADHPSCAPVAESLARVLYSLGRAEEADALFERAARARGATGAAGGTESIDADVSLDQLMGSYPAPVAAPGPDHSGVPRTGDDPLAGEELSRLRADLEAVRSEAARLSAALRASSAAQSRLASDAEVARIESESAGRGAREAREEAARARSDLAAVLRCRPSGAPASDSAAQAVAEAEGMRKRLAQAEKAAEAARAEAAAASSDALHARREAVAARAAAAAAATAGPAGQSAGEAGALRARVEALEARLADSAPVGPAALAGLSAAELRRAQERLAAGAVAVASALAEASAAEARACLACGARPRAVLALPCRHLALCGECFEGPGGARCPLCGLAPDPAASVRGALLS